MKLRQWIKRGGEYIRHGVPVTQLTVPIYQLSPSDKLKGKNIIVTGGGRGLGFEMAKKFISEGAKVIIVGRDEETLKKATYALGKNSKYISFDVSNIENLKWFIDKASKMFGEEKIDCLVSNAGVSLHEGDFRNVNIEGWNKQFDINLKGNYFLVKAFIEYLEKQKNKSGNILVVSSERAKRADDIPYGLTKTAVNSFIQGFASKITSEGIRINGIAPGVTASDMTGFDKNGELYAPWQPNRRIFLPEEVAEVAAFLLSEVSSCICGEIITCDAGRYISTW